MINQHLLSVIQNLNYLIDSGYTEEEIDQDIHRFFNSYTMEYLGKMKDFSDYTIIKEKIRNTGKNLKSLMNSISKSVDNNIDTLRDNVHDLSELQNFRKSYPFYVKKDHPKEALKFYKELEEETYNLTRAGKLLSRTRHTIKRFQENNLNGFIDRGDNRVTKQEVYLYYVASIIKKKGIQ
jgi:hypothetical protein